VTLRVTLVTDYTYSTGGIEEFVLALLRLAPLDVTYTVLSWAPTEALRAAAQSLVVVEHGDVRAAWSALDDADVVLVVTSHNVRLLALLCAEWAGDQQRALVTVVQTSQHSAPQDSAAPSQRAWLRQLLASAAFTVAVSDDVRDSLAAVHPAGANRLCVIENAARLSAANRQSTPERRKLTFLGRPVPQKGLHLFERLASDLTGTELRFHANTVSIPVTQPADNVTYSDNLSDQQLLGLFDESDLVIAPYLWADGLPLALVEALNCGVPVLGFDAPGVGQLLRRHDQLVVAPHYEALFSAVLAWARGDLTVRAPSFGTVDTWERVVDRYVDLLRQAALRRSSP